MVDFSKLELGIEEESTNSQIEKKSSIIELPIVAKKLPIVTEEVTVILPKRKLKSELRKLVESLAQGHKKYQEYGFERIGEAKARIHEIIDMIQGFRIRKEKTRKKV